MKDSGGSFVHHPGTMSEPSETFIVAPDQAGKTLEALLRVWLPGLTWKQVRQLIAGRRVQLNEELWLDPVRRLKEGDAVAVLARPEKAPQLLDAIVIRHIDEHLIVVEKPAGIPTVRHPAELEWEEKRRVLVPTLDDLVLHQIGAEFPKKGQGRKPRLRIVHRLDKETSGLVVFARTVEAERGLGSQFARHQVLRRYLALVGGSFPKRTMRTFLVRDRGDGRRGSTRVEGQGKEAITHVEPVETLPKHTLLSCRLETGRTHQIRIHLSEMGHPVWGEKVYDRHAGGELYPHACPGPHLFLHACELGFTHPLTQENLHWDMPLPDYLREVLERLREARVPR